MPRTSDSVACRGRYRPSGRVDLLRFAAFAAVVLAAAAGCSWLFWQGFEHRFYLPVVFELWGVLIAGGLALLAVRLGHCRSPSAALAFGLLAGLVLQPGHHVLAYVADHGLEALADPAGFVRHLDARFSAVEIDWSPAPNLEDDEDAEPSPSDARFLWATTLFGSVLIPLLCALPPFLRVRRNPYCEAGGEWAERTRLAFLPGAEGGLLQALDDGNLAAVAAAAIIETHPNQPALIGLLDACPDPAPSGVAGYLSLRQTRGDAAATIVMEPLFPYYRLRRRCAALSAAEVEALQGFQNAAGTAKVAPSWALESDVATPADLARLETIEQSRPPPLAKSRGFAELLHLVPLFGCGALGFALLAASAADDVEGKVAGALAVSGFAMMLLGLWLGLMDPHLAGDRYLLRRLVERLSYRSGVLVRPTDADAVPVALVPRSAWAGGRAAELVDHGLLAVRDAVYYEGDRHRMRIPAGSIRGISLEPLTFDQFQKWYFVVLEVRAADGLHTLPFIRVAVPLREALFRGKERRSRVLLARVASVMSQGGAGGPQ